MSSAVVLGCSAAQESPDPVIFEQETTWGRRRLSGVDHVIFIPGRLFRLSCCEEIRVEDGRMESRIQKLMG